MKLDDPRAELERVLDALESMYSQHCGALCKPGEKPPVTADGRPMFNHMFMSSNEDAEEILVDHGRITQDQCQVF